MKRDCKREVKPVYGECGIHGETIRGRKNMFRERAP
jgi:hypothetical protein